MRGVSGAGSVIRDVSHFSMTLPGTRIPELANLAPETKDDFFRKCDESEEMQHFRSVCKRYTGFAVIAAILPVPIVTDWILDWSYLATCAVAVPWEFVALFSVFYGRTLWQVRIIRGQLRRALSGISNG
jgi:hypothetical protein